MIMALIDLSAIEIAQKIRQREVSTVDVLDSALSRIRAVDGRPGILDNPDLDPSDANKVHAFIHLTEDLARRQAGDVDHQLDAGMDPGPLAGVPVTIKDIFCVKDTLTTAGSRILSNFTAPYTATPVARLQAAGAVILGKVNLDEFTYGSSSESSAFQPCPHNPWQPGHVTGGSSGGSAASVAADEASLSLGTDTGGSIRQPSSFCGVVGMKPTYGRTSRYGLIAFGSSLDCPGPIARSVADAALMLQVIAGPDPQDSTASKRCVPNYLAGLGKDLRGMRIGLSPDYFSIGIPNLETGEVQHANIQPEIEQAVLQVAEVLASQGAEIVENVPMPNTVHGIPVYFVISRVEASSNLHRFDGVKYGYRTQKPVQDLNELYRLTRAEGFGLEPKLRILMGMYVSAAQYSAQYHHRALRVRSMIRHDFDVVFDPHGAYRLDALLTPTTPSTAFKLNAVYGDSVLMQYADYMTVPANHAGIPGISIPAGFDQAGLPIGIQLMGADFREDNILRVAYAFEQATINEAWRKVKPQVLQMLEE